MIQTTNLHITPNTDTMTGPGPDTAKHHNTLNNTKRERESEREYIHSPQYRDCTRDDINMTEELLEMKWNEMRLLKCCCAETGNIG